MNVTPWPATGLPGKGLRVEAPRAAPTTSSRGGEAADPRGGEQAELGVNERAAILRAVSRRGPAPARHVRCDHRHWLEWLRDLILFGRGTVVIRRGASC